METLIKKNKHDGALVLQHKILQVLTSLEKPTKEAVAKELSLDLSSDASALVPFTGYYSLNTSPGAFISIDTTQVYVSLFNPSWVFNVVNLSISTDGTSAKSYKFDSTCSFDGTTLSIPSADLTLTLTRAYSDGVLTTFTGTLGSASVSGNTRFNPVPLSTFLGKYKLPPSNSEVLTLKEDVAMQFNFGQGLKEVCVFSYVPSMYVLLFPDTADSSKQCELMLGTAGSMGLACSIQSKNVNGMALTIPPSE